MSVPLPFLARVLNGAVLVHPKDAYLSVGTVAFVSDVLRFVLTTELAVKVHVEASISHLEPYLL